MNELRPGLIAIGGGIVAVTTAALTGSVAVFWLIMAITIVAAISVSRAARQALQAGVRGVELERLSIALTKRDKAQGLTAPGMDHTAPGDMSIDDFNRATRVNGQAIVGRVNGTENGAADRYTAEQMRRDMLRDGKMSPSDAYRPAFPADEPARSFKNGSHRSGK